MSGAASGSLSVAQHRVEPAGELLRLAQGIRTTYSKLHTSWNPEFIGPNLLKDTLAAAATLNLEQGPAFTAKALNPVRIKDSLMAIMAYQHGRDHKLLKDVVEWMERGGMTGWNLQPETLRKRFDQLEKKVDLAKNDTTGKHVVLAWLKGKKIVEDLSSAAENAVRFSVYRAFIEAGASPDEAARQSKTITIDFESGVPVSLNGQRKTALEMVKQLNTIGGRHGVGIIDMVENRRVGIKSREIYEAPGAMVLITAHSELEHVTLERELGRFKRTTDQRWAELVYDGLWFSPLKTALESFVAKTQEKVTGEIRLVLHGGHIAVNGRRSPESLYDFNLATYDEGDTFDQSAAKGFVHVHGLSSKIAARRDLAK